MAIISEDQRAEYYTLLKQSVCDCMDYMGGFEHMSIEAQRECLSIVADSLDHYLNPIEIGFKYHLATFYTDAIGMWCIASDHTDIDKQILIVGMRINEALETALTVLISDTVDTEYKPNSTLK